MTGDVSVLAAAAKALNAEHAALLTWQPCPVTPEQIQAFVALDAARDRLRGGERPPADQMSLDLHGR